MTKITPFKALYGQDPPSLLRGDVSSSVEDVNQLLHERSVMLNELKEQLVKAQNKMKTQVDKHKQEVDLVVGEKLFLKI